MTHIELFDSLDVFENQVTYKVGVAQLRSYQSLIDINF